MKKIGWPSMVLSTALLCTMGIASAALPEPQDPLVLANMSFEQRLQLSKELREEFKNATPEERREYRQKMHAKFKALSVEQRAELRQKMHAQWEALTPEQKQQLRDNRKFMIADLTPEEREEMKQRREHWKKKHADDSKYWNDPVSK